MNNGRITKRFFLRVFCFLSFLVILSAAAKKTYAAEEDLDEILNYEITVDVNEDGTLDMTYQIDWKVLDSTSKGPLTWVMIGIPNEHYKNPMKRSLIPLIQCIILPNMMATIFTLILIGNILKGKWSVFLSNWNRTICTG